LLCGLSLATFACGSRETLHPEWGSHFDAAGAAGCLIIYDAGTDRYHRYNPARCRQGFLPASTFKIFNSLVALETGVAPDENLMLHWDGQQREISDWNRDHTMRSAIKYSVVWYYQELARRIGADSMREYLDRAAYGNGDLSAGLDQFWLQGRFRVTPEEQMRLLRRLYANDLPFSNRNQSIVKDILVEEQSPEYVLRAKSGLTSVDARLLGWWIGYVERGGSPTFFVLNMESNSGAGAAGDFIAARQTVVKQILRDDFKLLPGP
jgi:beta-lactamase class D